jgi:membrane-associated phospholipid phosphatase
MADAGPTNAGSTHEPTLWPSPKANRRMLWISLAVFLLFSILELKKMFLWIDLPVDRWVLHNVHSPLGRDQHVQVFWPSKNWTLLGYTSLWGEGPLTLVVTWVGIMALLVLNERRRAIISALSAALGGWLILTIRAWFHHEMDPWVFQIVPKPPITFPSGHAAGGAQCWGYTIFFLLRTARERDFGTPKWVQAALLGCWIFVMVAVGLDRVLVRDHVISDIPGGWALGIFLLAISLRIDDWFVHRKAQALAQDEAQVKPAADPALVTGPDAAL